MTAPSARPPWAGAFPGSAVFDGDRLTALGGVGVDDLADEYGTPLYVMDHAELVGRMRAYRAAFGDGVAVTYAAKALCVTGVLQLAEAEGLYLDVASGGELYTAQRAGFPMERVFFHGNNKAVAELRQAALSGVGRVVVDSFSELARLEEVGQHLDHVFEVQLRVTPGVEAHTHAFIRTGHDDSKFGFTLSAGLAHRAAVEADALPHVDLRGVHCHLGSQILRTEAFAASAVAMCELLAELRDDHGIVLDELNLGGGLGIVYAVGDDPPALSDYATTVLDAVAGASAEHGLGALRLAVEPGRSLAGPAGVTLYTVGTVKHVPGVRTYVSVDGGMSDNPRPALYDARYTFARAGVARGASDGVPEPAAAATRAPVAVVGKHCETGDVLGRDVPLPADVAEGDLVAVAATGAYAHAMASNYNRLPRPAMVLVRQGRSRLLVRRETLDDLVARDVPLETSW